MKRIAIGLAVLALSALAAVAAADAQKMSTTHGLVSSVDASAGSLVVKADDGHGKKVEMTFVVDGESKIVKNGGAVALSDLKPDDNVTITFKMAEGKNLVVNIGVNPST
jgi:hypothetical protein